MSLLRRIAISRGDPGRKRAASEALAAMDRYQVNDWNVELRAEIAKKRRSHSRQPQKAHEGKG